MRCRVAVADRKHAANNPNAFFHGKPVTLAEHQASRFIAEPLHLLDCCQESDGGVAIVVTTVVAMVLAATGVTPNSSLAESLGISLEQSRVPVQADMSTSVDGVYAAGDIARCAHPDPRWSGAADTAAVVAAADETTGSVDEDGLAHALRPLG